MRFPIQPKHLPGERGRAGPAIFPETFDAVFIAFGIRNIMNRPRALSEFYKVLKPGGKLAVLELTTPGTLFKTHLFKLFQKSAAADRGFFSKDNNAYYYLPESVLKFPGPDAFAGMMSETGFSRVRFKPMSFGIVTLFVGTRQ